MSEINIVTAQNVTLKIELANIGDRFLAAILDVLIKIGATFLIALLFSSVSARVFSGFILILLWCFYSLIFELIMKGQSPGKRVMKVRVARIDGAQLTFGNIILRWLFRMFDFPLSITPTIGICAIVISEKHQRLGDLVAATILVSTKERTPLMEAFNEEIEPGYIPSFPQAERLTQEEVGVIQQVFYQYREHDKYDLITVTTARVKSFLQVHTNLDDVTFLKTVLKDYSFSSTNSSISIESKESFSFSL